MKACVLLLLAVPFSGCGSSASAPSDATTGGDAATSGGNDAQSSHAPNPRLAGIADGTAIDLGKFTCSSPAGEDPTSCHQMTDYSGFVYDPKNHQMLAFGG